MTYTDIDLVLLMRIQCHGAGWVFNFAGDCFNEVAALVSERVAMTGSGPAGSAVYFFV